MPQTLGHAVKHLRDGLVPAEEEPRVLFSERRQPAVRGLSHRAGAVRQRRRRDTIGPRVPVNVVVDAIAGVDLGVSLTHHNGPALDIDLVTGAVARRVAGRYAGLLAG